MRASRRRVPHSPAHRTARCVSAESDHTPPARHALSPQVQARATMHTRSDQDRTRTKVARAGAFRVQLSASGATALHSCTVDTADLWSTQCARCSTRERPLRTEPATPCYSSFSLQSASLPSRPATPTHAHTHTHSASEASNAGNRPT